MVVDPAFLSHPHDLLSLGVHRDPLADQLVFFTPCKCPEGRRRADVFYQIVREGIALSAHEQVLDKIYQQPISLAQVLVPQIYSQPQYAFVLGAKRSRFSSSPSMMNESSSALTT